MTYLKNHSFKVLLAIGYYLLVAFPLVVSAGQVTLEWDANILTPDGYNLYQRVDGNGYDYDNPVNDEIITGTTYLVDEIEQDVRYFFVVTALKDDEESEDSEEISYIENSLSDNGGSGIDDSVSNINGGSAADDAAGGCFIGVGRSEEQGQSRVALYLIVAGLFSVSASLFRGRRNSLK